MGRYYKIKSKIESYTKANNYSEAKKQTSLSIEALKKTGVLLARTDKEKAEVIAEIASMHNDMAKAHTKFAQETPLDDKEKAKHFIEARFSYLEAAKHFSQIKYHQNAAQHYDAAADAYKWGGKTKSEEFARAKAAKARSDSAEAAATGTRPDPIIKPSTKTRAPRREVVYE